MLVNGSGQRLRGERAGDSLPGQRADGGFLAAAAAGRIEVQAEFGQGGGHELGHVIGGLGTGQPASMRSDGVSRPATRASHALLTAAAAVAAPMLHSAAVSCSLRAASASDMQP